MTIKNTQKNPFRPRPTLLSIGLFFSSALLSMTALGASERETVELQEVEVKAEKQSDTKPVKGYNAKRSTSATRTDTELVNVPQAITVITRDFMQDQSMQSIADAVRYVPGVQAAQGEGNRDQLVLRGNQTTGDLFVDGLRDDIQTYRDLYNTDRIEVLKGPNGMIFGRGGAGGVVNRVSKKAGWDPVRDLSVSYGSFDHRRITADYGQGLSEELAFRLNAVYENSNSYRDGVELKRYGMTPTFTIKPGDKTEIVLSAEYFKDERTADRGIPSFIGGDNSNLNNRPYRIKDYDKFFGNAKLSPTETETVAFNAAISHAFDNGVQVKNSTRLAYYDKYYQNVYANSSVTTANTLQLGAYRDETKRENLINQTDITYTAKTGNVEHKLLAGTELAAQDTTNKRLTQGTSENLTGSVSADNPTVSNVAFNATSRNQKSDFTVAAIYLQDQIVFNPKWQAVLGLRHDHLETNYTDLRTGNFANINVTNNLLSPRAGLIYKPTTDSSLYASYSTSYVPRAGDQLIGLTVSTQSFKPEKFINKEVGAKWDINPNLALTAAIFQLERENVLAADPTNTGNSILLDGQETKGLEVGLSGKVTDQWQVMGAFTLQEGEITKQQGAGNSAILAGSNLAMTPTRTFSLWNKYQINDMWAVALGMVSRSEMYAATPTASQSTLLPGYTRFDAAIFAKLSPQWDAQINIENLTNKDYALFAHNNNNITPGAPLNARATLNYHF
ncbi:TonB-dependent siderophore receptor [Methylophilus sp. VKM B-3414]|uniref:TonB-dependent receptor n=1 Tax=Methylophilus sp. VKM B-3414 TaxID=3076121 RepID=UPI0028C91906|nr:TonB-dependent siderophore receptor [Methylophilus sp. VKM B-3414]MDT7848072.1 TonB-dependent siderophore receptor [Methylophilus sp. VKM B-3414]